MKLLFITQKVDRQDAVLGFTHRWLEKLSEQFKALTVICLQKGECDLPGVRVFSLGKEYRASRVMYVQRFYRFIRQVRGDYDAVLVHMNPIYVMLGCVPWRTRGKKVVLWYNHEYGNLLTRAAVMCAHRVLYTSPHSFAAGFANSRRMPAGIDTDLFRPGADQFREHNRLLYVGRISPIKNIDVLCEAVRFLRRAGRAVRLDIVGDPGPDDTGYYAHLKTATADLVDSGALWFHGSVPNYLTPPFYQRSRILFNLSPPGLFDKTVLEAMACETPVLVSGGAFNDAVPGMCRFSPGDVVELAEKIEVLLALSEEQVQACGRDLRRHVVEQHSLDLLAARLSQECSRQCLSRY